MHCRLTRAERLATRFARALTLALTLALALGCGNVELVGVDRATGLMADARVDARPFDANTADRSTVDASARDTSARDASAYEAGASDAAPARASVDSGALDSGALAVWSDPARPPPLPGQFVEPRSSCPAIEPTYGIPCQTAGQQCDYPICWGRGNRSWVCVNQRYTLWFDESFLCADARPCPAESPRQGAVCSLSIECVYPYICCKGPTGFLPALCDGHWNLGEPECGDACGAAP